MLYLFTIFHRLNSGGVRLTNQEIRNCIYSGHFNNLLKAFDNKNSDWKAIKKRIWGSMDRFRSTEVLLRVLALSEDIDSYDGNLARFLNSYMHRITNESPEEGDRLLGRLSIAMSQARKALGQEHRRKLSLVLVEALLVALYVVQAQDRSESDLQLSYQGMVNDIAFSESARYAVSSVDNVNTRVHAAISAFSS
jgi:hypothetical protein